MTTSSPEDKDPDYPIDPVPDHARKSAFSLLIVLAGFVFFIPTMLAGSQLGKAFSFPSFLMVILAGNLILGVYVAILGGIGARTGLTTVMMGRYALGKLGAKGASLLLGGTQVGWFGVTVAALAQLTVQAFGWEGRWALWGVMVAGGALMGITAYYGYRAMYWLSVIALPPMFILGFWVTAMSVDEVGGWSNLMNMEGGDGLAIGTAITIIIGTFASGGTQVPNWSRFSRTGKRAFTAVFAAFFLGNLAMLFFGGVGAAAFNQDDFVMVLYELGLVVVGLLLLLGALWTTNDNAAYAFGVAGAEISNIPNKGPFIIGGTVIGTLLAITGIYTWLLTYLVFLGILVPPLGGVIIGDWLRSWRHGVPPPAQYEFVRLRISNVLAYAVGALVAWGTGELQWGIAPVNGVLVAIAGVWVFGGLLGDRPRRQADVDREDSVNRSQSGACNH